MAEEQRGTQRPDSERAPTAPELLHAAMEKVVFFEWRVGELAAELAAAQSRASAAELERSRAAEECAAAQREAQAARAQAHELEAERARLASLLARPWRATSEAAALQAARDRTAQLETELLEARREIDRQHAERDRWLNEMLAQARGGGEATDQLAAFISELRGEVIALRDREKRSGEALQSAGPASPAPERRPLPPAPPPEADRLRDARDLWEQKRIGDGADLAAAAGAIASRTGAAAGALAEQCLRSLSSSDAGRREQAARHLAAVPAPAAAPALASALGTEKDARARAQIARALIACGGPGAADLVSALQHDPEPLVRLAALDALCGLPDRMEAALETAVQDPVPAVRRRAAALAAACGAVGIGDRLALDPDRSVRAAASPREPEAPDPRPSPTAAPARDLARDALHAVQAAIFGLTEAELAGSLEVPEAEASALAARLVSAGRLARRGKRLVAAGPAAAAQGGN